MSKPTIVLVHGAWADAFSWNAVAAHLRGQGYSVLAPPRSSTSAPAARSCWSVIRTAVS